MKSTWSALVVMFALLVIGGASTSHAQIASPIGFGLVGGTTSPSGNLSDVSKSGWHAGAFLELTLPVVPVGFRLEGAYHQLGTAHFEGGATSSARVLAGTLDATYTLLPLPIIKPYFIGGVGEYNVKTDVRHLPVSCDSGVGICPSQISESAFGINAGAGVRVQLAGFAAFLEARWHDIFTNGKHVQMVPVSVGFRF
ncbi:MAG TPA: porin family protein [Gemmatimonadaceae bacterium]|nr:porin family protein [Gemmatimonadaceae bacterium]